MDLEQPIEEGRGRSAKKRAAKEVENLACRLVELSEAEFAKLPVDGELRGELALARATSGHSSRRRQIKHFAGCLRRDLEQRQVLEDYLQGCQVTLAKQNQVFHRLEELRDRLCRAEDFTEALAEVGQLWPCIDLAKLGNLARSVHATSDKKAAREIFRRLRDAGDGG